MNIGQTIKRERLQKKLSQLSLAKLLCVSQDAVSLWELNKRTPNIQDLLKLANLFSISLEELLGIDKDANGKYIL